MRVESRRAEPISLLRVVDEALRRLHDPALRYADVGPVLEGLVASLDAVGDPVYVPAAMADLEGARREALTMTPVRRPDGTLEGALWHRPCDELCALAVDIIASQGGAVLAALSRLEELERRERSARRVAERLQDALLPSVSAIPETNVAVRYRAASREARVGGDFYDLFALPDGRVLIVVGDVVGKGIEAASHLALITQTCRALALQRLGLTELVERVDEQVRFQNEAVMATMWCGLYEPHSGELEFASLGHPPALLVRADGTPIHLTLEGLPLGMRDLSPDPPEIRARLLEPRDLLVLYTDGVVEASKDYLAGQRWLHDAIERRRDAPVEQLVDAVLDELLADAGHSDDAVLMALRRR